MSDYLRTHGLQHTRLPCPSLSPGVCSNSLMCVEFMMLFSHLVLCRPFLLLSSILPSIMVFSNESVLHIKWPKYWSFSFSISPSNEHPGLISFRMDWLDLLAVQGTRDLLQILLISTFIFLLQVRRTPWHRLPTRLSMFHF